MSNISYIISGKEMKVGSFLLSLDEIDRVKRLHGIRTLQELEDVTHVTRKTWRVALDNRKPTPAVLEALARLEASPSKVLVYEIPVAA